MSIKQLSVFLENRPGKLYDLTALLAAHGIDMRALSIAETTDFGIARIIVNDAYQAARSCGTGSSSPSSPTCWPSPCPTSPAASTACWASSTPPR